MNMCMVAPLLLLGAPAISHALIAPKDIDGPLNTETIQSVLEEKAPWFERATTTYTTRYNIFEAVILVTVSAEGAPSCTVTYSTIPGDQKNSLYCAVANTLSFPRADRETRFSLQFPVAKGGHDELPGVTVPHNTEESLRAPKEPPARITASPSVAAEPKKYEEMQNAGSSGIGRSPCENGIAGHRSDESIQECFDAQISGIFDVYQTELAKNPTAGGTIVINLSIAKSGTVESATLADLKGTISSATAEKIRAFVAGISFGKAADTVTTSHTFNFSPQ